MAAAAVAVSQRAFAADAVVRRPTVRETKAVFGQVESRNIVPARARIGGTIREIRVRRAARSRRATSSPSSSTTSSPSARRRRRPDQGARVAARQRPHRARARPAARARAASPRRAALDRRGPQVDVLTNQVAAAEAERAVIAQQASEGEVLAPATGRVLTVPVTARLGGPARRERSRASPRRLLPAPVAAGAPCRARSPKASAVGEWAARLGRRRRDADATSRGRIVKVYPEIDDGRVIADVEVDGLGDYLRRRARAGLDPGRQAHRRSPCRRAPSSPAHGVDYVRLAAADGPIDVAVVLGATLRTATARPLRRDPVRPAATATGSSPAMKRLGIAGGLTRAFIPSPLTPLFLLASLRARPRRARHAAARGGAADLRADGRHPSSRADGLKAEDAVKLVTEPLETIVKSIDGVEHVYSQTARRRRRWSPRASSSAPSSDAAILRVHEKMRANMDRIPVGIPEPLIVGRGIDDVAIVVADAGAEAGGGRPLDRQRPDPRRPRAAGRGRQARRRRPHLHRRRAAARRSASSPIPRSCRSTASRCSSSPPRSRAPTAPSRPARVRDDGRQVDARRRPDAAGACRDRQPPAHRARRPARLCARRRQRRARHRRRPSTRVTDVAQAGDGLERAAGRHARHRQARRRQRRRHRRGRSSQRARAAAGQLDPRRRRRRRSPATTARRPTRRPTSCCSTSASRRSRSSCWSWLAIGWREALVVAVVIPTTILLTLFAAWLMGYTLNRVSLFALIFSIGILVDDAIVVIENIARHWAHERRPHARAGGDRRGGRGRQPDHRRDADRGRGAAADAVRVGHDGPLHEPDPGQRLGGDDLLLLRRRDRSRRG